MTLWSAARSAALGGGSWRRRKRRFAPHSKEEFEARARDVTPDEVRAAVRVSADLADHIERIRRVRELGVSELYLHNVGRNQAAFIEAFGRRVLPAI